MIELKRGWNAVYLEVEPLDRSPAAVFEGKPVTIAARYFRLIGSVEFITDPAEQPWKQEGWGVWYAPQREDAFLTSLHAIQGNQAYLVHATDDFRWSITGRTRYARPKWRHNSYNLVGAALDPGAPPTFGTYFAGSDGKIGQKVYRLQNDKWVKVLDPGTARMKSGEAFWTWCEGKTDFAGPLNLEFSAPGLLEFGERNNRLKINWRSQGEGSVTVESVAPSDTGSAALPLHWVKRDLDTLTESYPRLSSKKSLAVPGEPQAGTITLQVRREDMSAPEQGTLLKFTDGTGAVAWVPVTASQPAE